MSLVAWWKEMLRWLQSSRRPVGSGAEANTNCIRLVVLEPGL